MNRATLPPTSSAALSVRGGAKRGRWATMRRSVLARAVANPHVLAGQVRRFLG
jgi:hypothetical protein